MTVVVDEVDSKMSRLMEDYHPLNATIEVTERCNAKCPFCYLAGDVPEDLDTETMLRVIDKLDQAGIIYLGITGGEPFLRNDILALLSHVVKKNFFKTSILTNGTVLTDDHIRFLVEYRNYFSFVRFSVFSHINKVHDEFCGIEGALEKTVENGKRLLAGGINVNLMVNVVESNINSFDETRRHFASLGFNMAVGMTKLICSQNAHQCLEPLTTRSFFERIFNKSEPEVMRRMAREFMANKGKKNDAPHMCSGIVSGITVTCRGDILPCVSFRNLKIGNILSADSLTEELRSNDSYRTLRSIKHTDIEGCRECEFAAACEICLGMVHSLYGSFTHIPEQFCNYAKALSIYGKEHATGNHE
jgi:AdoMet-dependent heme synthase